MVVTRRFVATVLVGVLALGLAGCPTPVVPYSTADSFARALFRVARENNASEWGTLLTRARRDQGMAYVQNHLVAWRKLILEVEEGPFAGDLSIARFRIENGALEFETDNKWVHLIRVEMEDGGWKINQD